MNRQVSSHGDTKENLGFKQLRLNHTRKNKEHVRLVISSIRVGVLAKTNDEIYVLSTIQIYSFHLFLPWPEEDRVIEYIESDVMKEVQNFYHHVTTTPMA